MNASARPPLFIKDCAITLMSTGEKASTLSEFKKALARIPIESLDHHYWRDRLLPLFKYQRFSNSFARWAALHLKNKKLAKQLELLDPTSFPNLEGVRKALIEILDAHYEEEEIPLKSENRFYFLHSIPVVFDKAIQINHLSELKTFLPKISFTSLFYHFIDARSRNSEGYDDFSVWLSGCETNPRDLIAKIRQINPYFASLEEIKVKLCELVNA